MAGGPFSGLEAFPGLEAKTRRFPILLLACLEAAQLWWPKQGGVWYFDIPSPNTIVFSVLWPTSIALWGSAVLPYNVLV